MREDIDETVALRSEATVADEAEKNQSEPRSLRVKSGLKAGKRTDEEQPGNEMPT